MQSNEHWGCESVCILCLCVVSMAKLLADLDVTQELVDDSQIT
jgi:hypothetical protein